MVPNFSQISHHQWNSFLSLVMRVPGLFILDYCWQHDLSRTFPQHIDMQDILTALSTDLVMVLGLLLLLLPLEAVRKFYNHSLSFGLLYFANHLSYHYIRLEAGNGERDVNYIKEQISGLFVHICIASIVAYLLGITSNFQRFLLAMYALPVVARLSGLDSPKILEACHSFSAAFMILQGSFYVSSLLPDVVNYYSQFIMMRINLMFELYGWKSMVINMWKRMFTPSHFLAFAVIQMSTFVIQRSSKLALLSDEGLHFVILSIISNACFSPISLIAECMFVSYAVYFTLLVTKLFLRWQICSITLNEDNIEHSGCVEGLAMIILSMQTNLIHLKGSEKMAVTGVILFIVISSMLQTIFKIVEPKVLELAASAYINNCLQNHWKRFRAVIICVLLLVCPLYMAFQVYSALPMDFWIMVIIFSCITTSIHALSLIVTHCLFVYDAYTKDTPWEEFDDIIFISHAGIRAIEFLIAIAVVSAGVIESLSETWNTLNSTLLAVHCYLNVWLQFQSGWKIFSSRREASKKIDSLPEATQADLKNFDDICAICYLQMKEARVTPCRHLFHGACLRKWLYMQDNCPMCHSGISMTSDGMSELVPTDR